MYSFQGIVALTSAEGLFCNSCGEECADACGTRFFRSDLRPFSKFRFFFFFGLVQFDFIKYRTCCFNYLRKRSSPPGPQQMLNAELEENNIWMNRAELDRLMRSELMREQNHLELNQKPQTKEEFQKSAPTSNTIYEI